MKRGLLLLLLLGIAPAAWAKPPAAPAKPAASAPAPSAAAVKKEEKLRATAFAEYDTQLASGQKARAADALVALLDDPALVAFHGEAYGKLGDLFAQLDLPYAALCAYVRAFGTVDDANVEALGLFVPQAIQLSAKVGDPSILEQPFSKNLGLARTEDVRGQMAWLAAKENFRQESYGVALAMLKVVKEGDPVYPDAKALEGVIFNQQSRPQDALTPLLKAQTTGRDKGVRFNDLVALNLARSYYAAGNFPRAIQAYAAVTRASSFWPQAQFERAWAHFRIDDINGSLGVLYSLSTPFFTDFYFPEADLLRIYSMFLMCKFPQANVEIDAFRSGYKLTHGGLKSWGAKSAEDNFDAARRFIDTGDTSGLPRMILRPWATEDRLLGAIAAVKSADDELARMKGASANPFTERAHAWLTERRAAIVNAEGARIQARIGEQEEQLGQMLADTEIFTLDILRMKIQLYEQAAITGRMEAAARTVDRTERLRKGFREWPFEGEIWADELGYYRVDSVPECPASMRREVPKQ